MMGGDLQSLSIASRHSYGVAAQVIPDDAHLAPHDVRIEGLARARPAAQKAGIEGDAPPSEAHACGPFAGDAGCSRRVLRPSSITITHDDTRSAAGLAKAVSKPV